MNPFICLLFDSTAVNTSDPEEKYQLSEIYDLNEIYILKDLYQNANDQRTLLQKSCNANLLDFLQGDCKDNEDICGWQRTGCRVGALSAIFARAQRPEARLAVDMDWLPPTLEYIHLHYVEFQHTWERMCLPRELRYLYLFACNPIEKILIQNTIDFSRLPQKMEEIILLNAPIAGILVLNDLPKTMRLIYVDALIERIVVDYNGIPESLTGLFIIGTKKLMNKVHALGKPAGVRVETSYKRAGLRNDSAYLHKFEMKFESWISPESLGQ